MTNVCLFKQLLIMRDTFFLKVITNTLILLTVNLNTLTAYAQPRPTVSLAQGILVGVKVYPDVSRVAINAFLGVPYAEPPEGRLRFAVPERHRGWNDTLYAANYAPFCPFRTALYEAYEKEDCLYLNIWTPENAIGYKLPVVVYLESEQPWLSDRAYVHIPGHDLAAEGVVVVSVSYRQNIFGFFCLGSLESRGNLGLLDQYLALLWIKENIEKFGGDSQTITLMGHSTSAAAIMYHMTSPRTTGLFLRAIVMSGSAIGPWYSKDPIEISKKLIMDLGCVAESEHASLECLRTKSVQEILRAFERQTQNMWYKSIMPVVDTFLPEQHRYLPLPLESAIANGSYMAIPMLTGITDFLSNAEQWEWSDLNQDFNQLTQYASESVIPTIIRQYKFDGPNRETIKETIRWKYLWSVEGEKDLAERIHDMQWMARVAAPQDLQLQLLTDKPGAPVFSYRLRQLDTLVNVSRSTVGGDLLLLFGPALLQQVARRRFSPAEDRLSKHLKLLWVTFAKRGNPSANSGYQDMWKPYELVNKYTQYFGNQRWSPAEYANNIDFWNKLLPHLAGMNNQPNPNSIPVELQLSPDPAAGFRHAMYTLVGLVVALLALLLVCVVLLKKRAKERQRHIGF